MACSTESKSFSASMAFAVAAFSASTVFSVYLWRRKYRVLHDKIRELEKALKSSSDKCAAERQGRIRAQQALRKELAQPKVENPEVTSYPMAPIGIIKSCFSTRNGTPRQPLLVPLAKACLYFNLTRVPRASLEGLGEYSHCWIIYVFHLNTDLEKLWKHPTKSKFKAKVRVPRLKGGKIGVFATRSPHRPCPIGLTIAKIDAVQGNSILLSGVDLVDGTPVLDIKPYLPYCDSIQGATVPKWLMEDKLLIVASVSLSEGFVSTLADCWEKAGKNSLYASRDEFQSLIKQVLSWDIRSVSQRNRPHDSQRIRTDNSTYLESVSDSEDIQDEESSGHGNELSPVASGKIVYHLILEGFDVSYRIDLNGNVTVEKASLINHLEQ